MRDLFLVRRRPSRAEIIPRTQEAADMDIPTRGTSCSIREKPYSLHAVRTPPSRVGEAACPLLQEV